MEAWQAQAIAELSDIVDPDNWVVDPHGWDISTEGDGETPGWSVACSGDRIAIHWGCLDFESDVHGGLAASAKRLLRAAKAWDVDPTAPAG